jgi:small subunit ribosomal protein S3
MIICSPIWKVREYLQAQIKKRASVSRIDSPPRATVRITTPPVRIVVIGKKGEDVEKPRQELTKQMVPVHINEETVSRSLDAGVSCPERSSAA